MADRYLRFSARGALGAIAEKTLGFLSLIESKPAASSKCLSYKAFSFEWNPAA